jgi:ATP-binding cassette subfamily B protein
MSSPRSRQRSGPRTSPTAGPATGPTTDGWLRRLAGTLRPYRRTATLAFAAALVSTAVAAATPLIERHILDAVVLAHHGRLAPWLGLLLLAGVVRFGSGFTRRYLGGALSLDVQRDLRRRVFSSLQRLDFATHDRLQTGQLVSRSNSDITLIQMLLGFLPNATGNILLFFVSLVIMLVLSPLLTVVALAVGPALLLIALRTRRTVFPSSWDAQQQAGEVATVVEEAVTGVRIVKGFGQEDNEVRRLVAAGRRLYASRVRAIRFTSLQSASLSTVPALGEVGVLALGGYLALHHEISLGTFLAFMTYVGELVAPVRALTGLLTIGQQARAGVVRVFDIIDAHPTLVDRPGARPLPVGPGRVDFDAVTFGYLPSEPVLRGVTLSLAPGETVAVVGGSGSGKSSLALLLPRFYDVQTGAVRIDGQDVRDLTVDSVRGAIGMVFEDSFLFSETVRANIAYGCPEATEEQIRAAARAAGAERFIADLPAGYDTLVGEYGLTLSGGQRQRVALARALLTDPRLLVLDDATSAVDAQVEEEIHAALAVLMRGRTTLLVAHRRSTLRLADRVAVLADGVLVDVGTEAELLERCPLFRRLITDTDTDTDTDLDSAADAAADAADAAADAGGVATGVGAGVTPALWQRPDAPDPRLRSPRAGAGAATGAGRRGGLGGGGMGGGGMGGGMSAMLGGLPPTPELVAAVDALPPATATPGVDEAAVAAPDPAFRLGRYLRPLRAGIAVALLLVVLDAAAGLAGPALVEHGLDAGVGRHRLAVLLVAALAYLVVTVLDGGAQVGQARVAGANGERALFGLRVKSFAHLQRLGLDFYEREMAGRIMTRMTTDVDSLSQFLQTSLTTAVGSLLSFLGVAVILFVLDDRLAAVTMLIAPPLVVATIAFRNASTRAYSRAREKIATVNANLQESISGVRVTQAFVRQGRNESGFAALNDDYRDARMYAQRLGASYFAFVEMLSEVAAAIVLGFGASSVSSGRLPAGVLIAFLLYLDDFFSPVQQLSQVFDSYQQAKIGLRRIGELLRTPSTLAIPDRPVTPPRLRGEVRFDDVSFSYAGAPNPAVEHVSLTVAPGETVAFVGETGAGKSTLVKLVARYYDVSAGRVSVDGIDVRAMAPSAYRAQLGVVPQEPFLFAGTIRDAIAYGRPDASDAQVEAAARAVGAHQLIARLPGGYLHVLGERGRSLSAGERQLLALARALLVDPAVLLLDEATATLDLVTEAAVNRAMHLASAARTTLVIAHRLTTAAAADRIAVLDGGHLVEVGPHEELLARGGRYAAMWEAFAGAPAAA